MNSRSGRWQHTTPARAAALGDARRQAHHAAQFATALGISYLRPEADDSHTNLGWNDVLGALESRAVTARSGAVAVGLRIADLTLLVLRDGAAVATIPLNGKTIVGASDALITALAAEGLEAGRFTLARHYEIPAHAVASGASFTTADADALAELARWFGNASLELERVARTVAGASEVRLWPHHFDIATLVTIGRDASTGAGMVGGDHYYDEPYFYVNAHPQPRKEQLTASLAGGGSWHTHEWIGAVLPASRVTGDAEAQAAQVRSFLDSALAAARQLVAPGAR